MNHNALYWFEIASIAALLYLVVIGLLANRTSFLVNIIRKVISIRPKAARSTVEQFYFFGWLTLPQRDALLKEYNVPAR